LAVSDEEDFIVIFIQNKFYIGNIEKGILGLFHKNASPQEYRIFNLDPSLIENDCKI
jgi:hypothetical protein